MNKLVLMLVFFSGEPNHAKLIDSSHCDYLQTKNMSMHREIKCIKLEDIIDEQDNNQDTTDGLDDVVPSYTTL